MIGETRQPDTQGDIEKRIEDLLKEHNHYLYGYLRIKYGARYAEDALQETWIRFHEHLKCHPEPENVRSFLKTIANHEAIRYFLKYVQSFESLDELENPDWEPTTDPWPEIIQEVDWDRILQFLSNDHREVVEMHIIKRIRLKEIARIKGIKEETIRSRLHLAIKSLKWVLAQYFGS